MEDEKNVKMLKEIMNKEFSFKIEKKRKHNQIKMK